MIRLLRTHLGKSWRAVAENLFDRLGMVPPPPALPPPSNTPSGSANAAALWRMRYAAATPPAKVPPTYAGSRINAGRRGDDTRTGSTRDDGARSTSDDEARSTRDDETRSMLHDDETGTRSTRGDSAARRNDHREKLESWYRERDALTRQCGDDDDGLRRGSEMRRRGSEEIKDGGLWRAGVTLYNQEHEHQLPSEGEDLVKRRSDQDLGRGKPDVRKRRSEHDLDDFAGNREMTYAAQSRDEMGCAASRRSEMSHAAPHRNEMADAGSSRNEIVHAAPRRHETAYAETCGHASANAAPSRKEIAYAEANRDELARAAPSRTELAYSAPCRAETAYSAPSRNEMVYAEPSRFEYGQNHASRDDKYAQDNEDERWRNEMYDSEKPRLDEVHEEAGDRRCRGSGSGTRALCENRRDGPRETVAKLQHESSEIECKDVNEVSRRMDSALEKSMRSRREAADMALTSGGAATDIVGEAAIPTHNPYRPTCFDVRTIPFALRKLHKFIFSPAPAGGGVVIRCFIERNRSGSNALFPVYKLYTDHEDGTGRFVMAARKVRATRTPHYVFSTSTADVYKQRSARGRNYLGKLRGNGATSSYVLYDKGEKPTALHPGKPPAHSNSSGGDEKKIRCEFAAISFSPRRGRRSSNPRHMEVALPQVRWRLRKPSDPPRNDNDDFDDGGILARQSIRPAFEHEGLEHMLTLIQGQGAQNVLYADRIAVCHIRKTRYDPLSSCLVDFKARASVASIKNFQLVKSPPLEEVMQRSYYATGGEGEHLSREHDVNQQPVLLQMGKVGRNCFNMDYQFPFSMFQVSLLVDAFGSFANFDRRHLQFASPDSILASIFETKRNRRHLQLK